MKFCEKCNNALYPITEAEGGASRQCRKCGFSVPITHENALVYEHVLQEDTTAKFILNPFLKKDPTLPRFKTIQCINASCPTRSGAAAPDVVGKKIDVTNVTWMYQCAICDTTWKQNARSI